MSPITAVYSRSSTAPLHRLCVFSRQIKAVLGWWMLAGLTAASTWSGSIMPPASLGTVRTWILPSVEKLPTSLWKMWASLPMITSSPRWQWVSPATRLAILPLGTYTAASLPNRSAAIASRRFTVGSSP